jgi:hypothetical protein
VWVPFEIHANSFTEEVVREKVSEKTGMKAGGFFSKAVGFAANKMVTDESIINNLAVNLKEKIEGQVREMGITAEVNKVFQKGYAAGVAFTMISS